MLCSAPLARQNLPSERRQGQPAPRKAPPERVDGLAGATGQVPRWLQVGQGWYFRATCGKLRRGPYTYGEA